MEANLFFKGMAIGFSIAAPVGPIGILCISRSLTGGVASGLASGLGAATADAFYGCVAGFGLTAVSDFLTGYQMWLGIAGGLFLCFLGASAFILPPGEARAVRKTGLASAYSSTLLLTLVNPMTILSFALVFAGLGLGTTEDGYLSAALLVAGVFSGSAAWWLVLSGTVSRFRHRFSPRGLRRVNQSAGALLITFGAVMLFSRIFPAARP